MITAVAVDVACAIDDLTVGDGPRLPENYEATLHDPVALGFALGDQAAIDCLVEDLAYRHGAELIDDRAEGSVERLYLAPGPPRSLYGTSAINRVRCHATTLDLPLRVAVV